LFQIAHWGAAQGIAMRYVLFSTFTLFTTPVFAHVGHVGELAGHDHLLAGAALGAAIGLAIWGALSGKDKEKATEADAQSDVEPDAEPQEA
jgi:hypothetical protein